MLRVLSNIWQSCWTFFQAVNHCESKLYAHTSRGTKRRWRTWNASRILVWIIQRDNEFCIHFRKLMIECISVCARALPLAPLAYEIKCVYIYNEKFPVVNFFVYFRGTCAVAPALLWLWLWFLVLSGAISNSSEWEKRMRILRWKWIIA